MAGQSPQRFGAGAGRAQLGEAFARDGFVVVEGLYTSAECEALMARAAQLIDGYDHTEYKTIFSTADQSHSRDDYFLGSGDRIRFFLEKDAVDASGDLVGDKQASVNKIGHALHDLDDEFSRFSRKPALAETAAAVGVADPLLLQSMYIFKPPRIGGEVHCHQDSTFLYTEPESCVGLWVALEDATIDNGCLWAAPGGHEGPLRQRFYRVDNATSMADLDATPMPEATCPLEASQGTLVALHGRVPHQSGPNTSTRSRQAYALHVIDAGCRYPDDNWLQRGADMPLRGFSG